MRTINDESKSIFDALNKIKENKYVIPAFQRQFLWDVSRIEKLWDSILLDYPFSTFLFWHIDDSNTTWDTYFMSFLNTITFNSRNQADSGNNNYSLSNIDTNVNDIAILDGQQRIAALYVSLYGNRYIRQKMHKKRIEVGLLQNILWNLIKTD